MPRKLISQRPESGVTERWVWKTDVITAVNRDEQRIAVREYPDETIAIDVRFDDSGHDVLDLSGRRSVVRTLSDALASRGEIDVPMWHLADDAGAGSTWSVGTSIAQIALPSGTPFRAVVGEDALVRGPVSWLAGTIVAAHADWDWVQIDFGTNTALGIDELTAIVPLREGRVESNHTVRFDRAAHASTHRIELALGRGNARTTIDDGYDLNVSSSYDWPVIEPLGVQSDLEWEVDDGTRVARTASGAAHYETFWRDAEISFSLRDEFDRYGGRLPYWRSLLAYLRGGQREVWYPTRRGEFRVLASTEETVTLEGREFFDLWDAAVGIRALCLDSEVDPICVRVVSACSVVGDDTVCEFDASLPWATPIVACSIALPCRLGDDVAWTHEQRVSRVVLQAHSVSVAPLPAGEPPGDPDLLAQFDASSSYATTLAGRFETLPIVGVFGGEVAPTDERGADVGVVNSLRSMTFTPGEFDPLSFAGLSAIHWSDVDSLRIAESHLAGVASGLLDPPTVSYSGAKLVPWLRIAAGSTQETLGGLAGDARWHWSYDGVTGFGQTRSVGQYAEPGFFAQWHGDGTPETGQRWPIKVRAFVDRGPLGTDLTPDDPLTGQTAVEYRAVEVEIANQAVSPTFTPVSGPMTVAIAGVAVASVASLTLLAGGSADQRKIVTDGSGGVQLVSGATSAAVGALAVGAPWLIVAAFDGATSRIAVMSEGVWTETAVNDGGAAVEAFDQIVMGDEFFLTGLFVASGEPTAEQFRDLREGFAREYGHPHAYMSRSMSAETDDADSWKVLHDNSEDWTLSLAFEVDSAPQDVTRVLELLRADGGAGFAVEWIDSTEQIRVAWIGGGTFEVTVDSPNVGIAKRLDVQFFSGGSPSADVYIDGTLLDTATPSGYSFPTTQDSPLIVGRHSGVSVGELILRRGSDLQNDYLVRWVSDDEYVPDFPIDLTPVGEFAFAGLETDATWKSDGTMLWTVDPSDTVIREYTASVAWDVTSLSLTDTVSIGQYSSCKWSPDGLTLVGRNSSRLERFSASVAFDIDTLTLVAAYTNAFGWLQGTFDFSPDGSFAHVHSGSTIYEVSLATPYQPSSGDSLVSTLDLSEFGLFGGSAVAWAPGETDGFYVGAGDRLWRMLCSTPGSTVGATPDVEQMPIEPSSGCGERSADGQYVYLVSTVDFKIRQYAVL